MIFYDSTGGRGEKILINTSSIGKEINCSFGLPRVRSIRDQLIIIYTASKA